MSKKIAPVKTFGDITGLGDFRLPLISELLKEDLMIDHVRIAEGSYGQYAIFNIIDKGEYRTNSKVLIEQAKAMEPYLKDGYVIHVSLKEEPAEEGSYYTFADPKKEA